MNQEVVIDYSGGTYETRLIRCTKCGKITIVGFDEDRNLNTNKDLRFYEYTNIFH